MILSVDAALRQFARTIFADRLIGDEFVSAVAAEVSRKGGTLSDQPIEAFRTLIQKWRDISTASAPRPFSNRALIVASGPPPDDAQLILVLMDILGFSAGETERILDPLSAPAEILLEQARQTISRLDGGSALIIEDEPLLAADLADLVERLGISVIGIARTAQKAIALAKNHRPSVILADYNLVGEKTGLEAVEEIQEEMNCPAIFITGFPEKVLTGESVEPDFVIAKPYTPQAVRAAIAQSLLTQRNEVVC